MFDDAQVPPEIDGVKVEEEPTQALVVPEIVGNGLTVTLTGIVFETQAFDKTVYVRTI